MSEKLVFVGLALIFIGVLLVGVGFLITLGKGIFK